MPCAPGPEHQPAERLREQDERSHEREDLCTLRSAPGRGCPLLPYMRRGRATRSDLSRLQRCPGPRRMLLPPVRGRSGHDPGRGRGQEDRGPAGGDPRPRAARCSGTGTCRRGSRSGRSGSAGQRGAGPAPSQCVHGDAGPAGDHPCRGRVELHPQDLVRTHGPLGRKRSCCKQGTRGRSPPYSPYGIPKARSQADPSGGDRWTRGESSFSSKGWRDHRTRDSRSRAPGLGPGGSRDHRAWGRGCKAPGLGPGGSRDHRAWGSRSRAPCCNDRT